ncbi:MAG: DUF1553 domain-containing protein [Bryobacteraceae bacterium]|nr:DUF1553 domain-containing protein [Bryobacteraceae bacterium]
MPLAAFLLTSTLFAAAPAKLNFNRDIRPILSDRCFTCHGPDEKARKAGLRLDTKEGAFARKGVIVAGDASASRLLKRVTAANAPLRMPPDGPPLTGAQIETLKQWVTSGATWDLHWSYVPPAKPPVPSVSAPTAIDKFVVDRLNKEGLKLSPEANKATLLRRLSYDVTGLPPTPDEIQAFLRDKSPTAYEKQVDRLLASPRFGERQAMQWLDLARYADTHGYHIDSHRDMWRWRDWVINSFNRNQPFNEFIVEQLAGDLLPKPTTQQILATGFQRNHMINFEGGAIPEEYQNEYVVDRVETAATVFMGMTMGCARCHDHKYDPISQKDFYRFGAFFNTIPEKGLDGTRGNAAPVLELPTDPQAERVKYLKDRTPVVEKELASAAVKEAYQNWQKTARLKPDPRQGLLAHYELDGSLTDSSGNYRHGVSLKDEFAYVASQSGDRAAELSGRSEVELAALPFPSANGPVKTISLWFQTRARTFKNGILFRTNAERQGWSIELDDPFAVPRMQQKARIVLRKVERWPDRVWEARFKEPVFVRTKSDVGMHLAFTADKVYLNGEAVEMEVVRHTLTQPFQEIEGPVTIGGRIEAERLRGRIDDIRFYDRELTPAELRILQEDTPLRENLALTKRAAEQETMLRDWYFRHAAPPEHQKLAAELVDLKRERDDLDWSIETVMVMKEAEKPRDTYLLARGDYRNQTEKLTPGVPSSMPPLPAGAPANRLTLAQWLTSPQHPLTARVAVNRFWQMYFGTGLVKTSEDFGSQGEAPSHPELLDWLATEYVTSGWDTKALQKQILLSATYRQASQSNAALRERDPENRLLARGPRFRLPAELVRDTMLAASGLLNAKVGGPSVLPYQPPGLWEELAFGAEFSAQTYQQSHGEDLYRRSMYTFWKRTMPPSTLSTFDAPDREKCVARRAVTNTPLQALALMNDTTYVEAARALAQRVMREAGPNPAKRVDRAFLLALARPPAPNEAKIVLELAQQKLADYRRSPELAAKLVAVGESKATGDNAELAAWTLAMSVVLNLDETITKE